MRNKDKERLEHIVSMLIEFSRGNFEIQLEVNDDEDPLNTVVAGLNMLGEELAHYKRELDHKNEFLQDILTGIDEVIYAREIDQEKREYGAFTFISRQSYDILGIRTEQLTTRPDIWSESIHPEDIGTVRKTVTKLFKGVPVVLSYRMYNPIHKEYRWIEDRIMPKKDANGIVIHLFGSARDITEQKTTNLELEKTNTLVSRVISSSDQLFYIVAIDEDNLLSNRFSYLSWQVERILGLTMEEINKNEMRWADVVHPDDLERVTAQNRVMFSTKEPTMRIYRVRHGHTGEYIWLEDYVVPVVNEAGRISELYGSARDITARKNAEQAQETLIKELSNKFNELMQFNYIVSHNLRAPVAHIKGLTALLDIGMSEDEVGQTLKYIKEAADSMDDLLKDLNIILSTKSLLNEKVEPVSLGKLTETVCGSLKTEIEKSGAVIQISIAPGCDELVSIKSYIQSALFNLISNAIKYRHRERQPVIKLSVAHINHQTEITVEDNGLGIDLTANAERIFGLYSRFHHEHEGKGLGLYMTKTQIESIGGKIDVKSEVGVGTVFTITL